MPWGKGRVDCSDSVDRGRTGETSWEPEPASESTAKDGAGEMDGCGTSLVRNDLTSSGVAGRWGNVVTAGVGGREEDVTDGVFMLPAIDPPFRS